jgi:hypothetical protein
VAAAGEDRTVRDVIMEARAERSASPEILLGRLQPLTPQRVAGLRAALADADPFVRRTAIELLSRTGDSPLRGLSRCLGDPDGDVREAAERAIVAAGPAAVQTLADLSAEESCTSPVKVAVVRTLGRIRSAEGVPALVDAAVKCRAGGLVPPAALDALYAIGAPSILPLVDLARYRDLKCGAYTTLLQYEPAELARALTVALADPGIDAGLRLHYAEQSHVIFGTEVVREALVEFAQDLQTEASVTPDVAQGARHLIGDLRSEGAFREPLSMAAVQEQYGDKALAKAYEHEANHDELLRRGAMSARREAFATRLKALETGPNAGTYPVDQAKPPGIKFRNLRKFKLDGE